jgi:colanic acid/amylovoran biosynthesis glycosyltransferase
LGKDLDWIHFGFAEIAIGRENLAKAINAKMAVSIRGYDVALFPLNRPGCYDLVWKRLDALHYLSNHLLNKAIDLGFDATSKRHTKITPAIDLDYFALKPDNANKNNNGKLVLVTIARLHWIKGLDDTILALSLLESTDFEYHIIGEGDERERLTFLIHELKLWDKVFVHGKQNQDYIKHYLNLADIYIQYSEHEGFCNSVLEAQATGLPCVVTDNSGISEGILEGITGLAIKPRRPDLLANAVIKLWSLSTIEKKQKSLEAARWVANNFSITDQAKRFIAFYNAE